MSSATALVVAEATEERATFGEAFVAQARHLRVLPAARPDAKRGPFLILMGAVLAVGLLGLLLLNTTLAQGSFVTHDLQTRTHALADQEQELVQKVSAQESPQVLEHRASAQGMVPSRTPVFLRLSDGAVLGVPQPARALRRTSRQGSVTATSGVSTGSGSALAPKTPTKTAPKTATKTAPKTPTKTATPKATTTKTGTSVPATGGTRR